MTSAHETSRERKARRSLDLLTVDRFEAFVRAVRAEGDCLAVELMNDELDAGSGVEDVFFTGEEFGYELAVRALGTDRFRIEFGCAG